MIPVADVVERFPGIRIDHDSLPYFQGLLERRLLINRCEPCGSWHHPPASVCPRCWSTTVVPTDSVGTGIVHCLVRVHPGPDAPALTLAVVELDDQRGLRFTASVQTGDDHDVEIGDRVHVVWNTASAPFPAFQRVEPEKAAR